MSLRDLTLSEKVLSLSVGSSTARLVEGSLTAIDPAFIWSISSVSIVVFFQVRGQQEILPTYITDVLLFRIVGREMPPEALNSQVTFIAVTERAMMDVLCRLACSYDDGF